MAVEHLYSENLPLTAPTNINTPETIFRLVVILPSILTSILQAVEFQKNLFKITHWTIFGIILPTRGMVHLGTLLLEVQLSVVVVKAKLITAQHHRVPG